ncbi:hypothetical protein [Tenggerimyces flavus]|uniref:Uncharacterized protein n=1 Tax=Tenggerimyces flavus TaxID=1708749 RepID=A0ABV7YHN8_9ACTN|nr:hypothetical protein [Tenggerimyces flavus]MBM7784303.1 hypothetical protein [Tenggerimyces flavus]
MSTLVGRQVARYWDALTTSVTQWLRVTPSSLVVRLVVLVAGLGALWVGVFDELSSGLGWAAMAVAAAAAVVFPASRYVLILELAAVLGWFVYTVGLSRPVTFGGLTLLAGTLYLHHVACALAAQVPYDAVVPWPVFGRWLLRAAAMIGATAVLAFVVVGLAPRAPAATSVLVPVLGFVLIGALLAGFVLLYKRKGPPA